jgi:hypothetical protein
MRLVTNYDLFSQPWDKLWVSRAMLGLPQVHLPFLTMELHLSFIGASNEARAAHAK